MGSIYNNEQHPIKPTMKNGTAKRAARTSRLVTMLSAVFIIAALVLLSGAQGEFYCWYKVKVVR